MNKERLTALSLAIETGTDMHFDKEELEWLIAAARERNALEAERDNANERAMVYRRNQDKAMVQRNEAGYERDTLRANNAALREALDDLTTDPWLISQDEKYLESHKQRRTNAVKALAFTPSDDLAEYRDGVLEEVAARFDQNQKPRVASFIRAMKAKT